MTILFVLLFYPLLHDTLPILVGFCIYLLPAFIRIVSRRLSRNSNWMRRAICWSGGANILIAAFLALNGMADHYPVLRIQTAVVRKASFYGKFSTSYYLDVTSWRQGQKDERLRVDKKLYSEAHTGALVVIELHRGFFGLPWGSRVLPI